MTESENGLLTVLRLFHCILTGREIQFDTESVDIVDESRQRWARQNHSAAEGLGVAGDFEEIELVSYDAF